MKKKIISALIMALLAFSVMLSACKPHEPQITKYTLSYIAKSGGYIEGNATQTVAEGNDCGTVTAVPKEGYEFVKWSDGVETAERTDKNITATKTYTATFKKITYSLCYIAGEHGKIVGESDQLVEHGSNGTKVTAVADNGYEFKNWSDGKETAERTDLNVLENKSVTAYFTEYIRTFSLNYKLGEVSQGAEKPTTVTLDYNNYQDYTFPVLTREHFTFGGWYVGETKVTDTSGKVVTDEDYIRTNNTEVYAKWTANETFTYKILLVYVTRIDAELTARDNTTVHVDYTMNDLEREFCSLTTKRLKRYLDDMLDGLVVFEIDEYFTSDTVTKDEFKHGANGYGETIYSLFPDYIKETKDMLEGYDSALSVTNLGEKLKHKLRDSSGEAGPKYGEVHLDSSLGAFETYGYTLKQATEMLKSDRDANLWSDIDLLKDYWFSTIIHELAHTIEQRVNLYDYHKSVIGELHINQLLDAIESNKLYYLNEAVVEGQKVGIPYEFWKGDIAKVSYMVEETNIKNYPYGGYINSTANHPHRYETDPLGIAGYNIYDVLYGTTLTVTAVPQTGFKFVKWSDGIETATRTDTNITGDLTVTAIFEKID